MTTPSRQSVRPAGGFTLTELLLVLLVVALLAALTFPALGRRRGGLRPKAAAYELVTLLRNTRLAAAANDRSYVVRISTAPPGPSAEVFAIDDTGRETLVTDDRWAATVHDLPVASFGRTDLDGRPVVSAEWAVWMTPTGVEDHYDLELDIRGQSRLRIEVRAPSGLVRLRPATTNTPEAMAAAMDDYWQMHCR